MKVIIMGFEHLDVEQALEQLGYSMKLYRIILDDFEEKYGTASQDIRSLSREGKLCEAERLAHTLKGLSGNLGAEQLQCYAAILENMYKTKSLNKEEECLSQLSDELKKVIEEVNLYLSEIKNQIS